MAGLTTPVISLWQPYAALIFHGTGGKKAHETRHFQPPPKLVGHTFAIHAAKRIATPEEPRAVEILHQLWGRDWRQMMHTGAILGTVRLVASHRTEEREPASEIDRLFGDWTPGRFAWELTEFRSLDTPVEMPGRQSWWKVASEALGL